MALLRAYQERASSAPALRDRFAERYRQQNRNRLRAWALMASNSHKIAIVVGSFLPFDRSADVAGALGLFAFFFVDLLLDVPMLVLIWT